MLIVSCLFLSDIVERTGAQWWRFKLCFTPTPPDKQQLQNNTRTLIRYFVFTGFQRYHWIGLNDLAYEGSYAWDQSGRAVSYARWASGQPVRSTSYNCAAMCYWYIASCRSTYPAICELDYEPQTSQCTYGIITTSLLRQNDVSTFWRNNDVIISSFVRWSGTVTDDFFREIHCNKWYLARSRLLIFVW